MSYRKVYTVYENNEYQITGTVEEVAEYYNVKTRSVRNWINGNTDRRIIKHVANQYQVYEFYNGETLVATGSVNHIADVLDASKESVRYYGNPSVQKRHNKFLIKLEGETVIEKTPRNIIVPKPENATHEPKEEVKYVAGRPEQREFKFKNDWINFQLNGIFRQFKEVD